MKTQTTRIPPNYGLILIILTLAMFWSVIIKVFFGHQIKEWIFSTISSIL